MGYALFTPWMNTGSPVPGSPAIRQRVEDKAEQPSTGKKHGKKTLEKKRIQRFESLFVHVKELSSGSPCDKPLKLATQNLKEV